MKSDEKKVKNKTITFRTPPPFLPRRGAFPQLHSIVPYGRYEFRCSCIIDRGCTYLYYNYIHTMQIREKI